MNKIALFASGSGTNAENIIRYFKKNNKINVEAVFVNKKNAGVIERAEKLGVSVYVFDRQELYESDTVLDLLKKMGIDLIVLAGFLWLVPQNLIREFDGRIINIHPAILPGYGGKGMYGSRVHKAVIDNSEKESGITIHYVNDKYDEGDIIFQAKCPVMENDTPESLASRIHELEYEHFPKVIENLLS